MCRGRTSISGTPIHGSFSAQGRGVFTLTSLASPSLGEGWLAEGLWGAQGWGRG